MMVKNSKKVIVISVIVMAIAVAAILFFLHKNNMPSVSSVVDSEIYQNVDTSRLFNTQPVAYTKAGSCDDYRKYLLDLAAYNITRDYFYGLVENYHLIGDIEEVHEKGSDEAEVKDNQSAGQSSGEFTDTNSQESSAEEIDIIKTDGNYMYILEAGKVHILKALPAQEMSEVAVLDVVGKAEAAYLRDEIRNRMQSADEKMDVIKKRFQSMNSKEKISNTVFLKSDKNDQFQRAPGVVYPLGMLLKHGQLIVFLSAGNNFSAVMVYDVSEPGKPKFKKGHYIEGTLSDVRFINDKVYAVFHNDSVLNKIYSEASLAYHALPPLYEKDYLEGLAYNALSPQYAQMDLSISSQDEFYEILSDLGKRVINMGDADLKQLIDEYAPIVRRYLEVEFRSTDYFDFPIVFKDIYNINTLPTSHSSSPLVSCNEMFIPNSVHVKTEFTSIVEFSFRSHSLPNIMELELSDSYTFVGGGNMYAANSSIYLVTSVLASTLGCNERNDNRCANHSGIHRISLEDGVQYIGSGEIKGIVSNPYRMSEYNGYLRVFSDRTSDRWNERSSSLSILDARTMKVTGQIDNIAKGEEIYASRMVGNRGYLVTFRQTDPVFTFDLSNPQKPELKGELKINGYSSYIHPLDENALLTIGRDAAENGNEQGVQLQIFDVSDLANPKRVHRELLGTRWNSFSSALSNSHAFSFHASSGLLAIPFMGNMGELNDSLNHMGYFSGFLIYHASLAEGFKRIGHIAHNDLYESRSYNGVQIYPSASRFWFKSSGAYDRDVTVYTVSNYGIKASDALSPENTFSVVRFPECMDDDYRYLYERNDYYMKFRGFDELNDSDLVDED